jgi:hypothetical protein
MGTGGSFSWVKRPELETDCSFPSSAEVKDKSSYISTRPDAITACSWAVLRVTWTSTDRTTQTESEGTFPYSQQTNTTEAKNTVAKLMIANSGKTSNREIREESEIVRNLQ